jgi:hypothetical protein
MEVLYLGSIIFINFLRKCVPFVAFCLQRRRGFKGCFSSSVTMKFPSIASIVLSFGHFAPFPALSRVILKH